MLNYKVVDYSIPASEFVSDLKFGGSLTTKTKEVHWWIETTILKMN